MCLLLLHAGHIIRTPVTSPVRSTITRKYGSASIALRLRRSVKYGGGSGRNNQWQKKHRQPTRSRQVLKRKTRHLQQWGSRKLPGIGLKYAQMASTALTHPLVDRDLHYTWHLALFLAPRAVSGMILYDVYVCSTRMMLVRVLRKDGEHLCTHLL